jgi:hypothetical protein
MNRPTFIEPAPMATSTVMDTLVDLAETDYTNYLADEWDSISFWEWRIRCLENRRARFTKKAAWSIRDLMEVEEIDEGLNEAFTRIDEIQSA